MIRRRALAALLALLLGFQWAGAAAHCLRLAPSPMEICSIEGIRHVAWPGEDQVPPGHAAASSFCAACALPGAATVPPPVGVIRAASYAAVAYARPPARAAPVALRPSLHQPRAPPAA